MNLQNIANEIGLTKGTYFISDCGHDIYKALGNNEYSIDLDMKGKHNPRHCLKRVFTQEYLETFDKSRILGKDFRQALKTLRNR